LTDGSLTAESGVATLAAVCCLSDSFKLVAELELVPVTSLLFKALGTFNVPGEVGVTFDDAALSLRRKLIAGEANDVSSVGVDLVATGCASAAEGAATVGNLFSVPNLIETESVPLFVTAVAGGVVAILIATGVLATLTVEPAADFDSPPCIGVVSNFGSVVELVGGASAGVAAAGAANIAGGLRVFTFGSGAGAARAGAGAAAVFTVADFTVTDSATMPAPEGGGDGKRTG
jgi:hypothetical protein